MRALRRYPFLIPLLVLVLYRLWAPPPVELNAFLKESVESQALRPVLLRASQYCRSSGQISRFEAELLGWFRDGMLQALPAQKVLMRVGEGPCDVIPGEEYQAWVKFSWPDRFQNPSSFDYPRYLGLQGIQAVLKLKSGNGLVTWRDASWYWRWPAKLRTQILGILERQVVSNEVRGILKALLVGDENELSFGVRETFRRTGLTHLLVVSGLHLTLVFLGSYFPFYALLSLFRSWADRGWARRGALLASLVPTAFYVAMAGASPSVLRAWLFACCIVLLWLLGWRLDMLALLIGCAGAILCFEPRAVFDLSFQFSFLAVLALVLLARRWRPKIGPTRSWYVKLRRGVAFSLLSSFAVNLTLFPVMVQFFHQSAWLAPLSNLIMVPLFSFVLHPLAMIAAIAELFIPGLGSIFFFVVEAVTAKSWLLLESMAALPGSVSWLSPLSWEQWLAWGLLCLAVFFLRRVWIVPSLILAMFLITFSQRTPILDTGHLTVRLFDVGQGESILVSLPDGTHLLVDGGGFPYSEFDLGRNVLIPEFLRLHISFLDVVILTHADSDHWKGLLSVVHEWEVGEFWGSAHTLADEELLALRKALQERKISTRALGRGAIAAFANSQLKVLWPSRDDDTGSDNNRSLVFEICHQNICWLLTGDLEAEAEVKIMTRADAGKKYILKTAHHGSKTSSSAIWLEQFPPELAVISAGRNNRFGLPHPEVLARFAKRGIPVFRTDLDGQIVVRSDGSRVDLYTFSGLRRSWFIDRPIPSWWFASPWEPFS